MHTCEESDGVDAMADGITITIDSASLAVAILMLYKLVSLEYRVKRLEEVILGESRKSSCRR